MMGDLNSYVCVYPRDSSVHIPYNVGPTSYKLRHLTMVKTHQMAVEREIERDRERERKLP